MQYGLPILIFTKTGSTHIHFVYKNARGATHEVLTKMWKKGMAYVTPFDQEKIPYFCKKERLDMYPCGTRLFTKSQNCKKPKRIKMSIENFENLTKNMECTHCTARTLYKQSSENPTSTKVNHFIYKKFKNRKEN